MRKFLTMLLVMIMVVSVFVTGCGNDKTGEGSEGGEVTKDQDNDETVDVGGPVTFPLDEQVKLTAFVHTRPNVDDYDVNKMTQYIENMTNIDLEFVVATENEAQEKLNLLLATGDYPDIILTSQLGAAQQSLYGSQGSLIALNDYIDLYGENTKRVFEEYPVAKDRMTMPDGNIYNLPRISECYHCKSTQKLWIYKPWLDALGLEMPQTTEDYYNVLKAFATQDPNGNGLNDEIPLAGANKGWEVQVEAFLMNAFVYNATGQSGASRLFVDNGIVTASYTTDGWKEGVKYLQMLRSEGLLADESFTQDVNGLKKMGENPEDVILGGFPGGAPGVALDMSGERWRDYVTVEPLEGPDGARFVKYDPFSSVISAFSITDNCEHPDIAFALGDLLYNQDISFMNSKGFIGEAWEWIDDDSKLGINGEKALWNELIPLAEQEPNGFWNQMGNYYETATLRLGRYQEDPNNIEVVLFNETKEKYAPHYPDIDMLLPPLILTEAQSSDLLTYSTSINEYVLEKLADFVLTDIDVDAAWDDYISELEAMGLPQMLNVYQDAYDAK